MFSSSKKTNPTPAVKQAPPSILSSGLTVNGDLVSDGEVQIDCVVNGDVTAGKLAIGENARVIGEVVAEQVLIRGEVIGRIRAKSVELDKSAKVRGDIWHELLSIAAGAKIEGLCKFAENPRETVPGKLSVVPAEPVDLAEKAVKALKNGSDNTLPLTASVATS
ncbi:polymer-forming cytoskeletal protein [uncultured Ferrovibrio sp.]|jgi:cytoskeletal protein CcmA (bactofilin family)|uniref:bactofilin family protein n=1 Tax=uncultured Ferrovibrio sp. TaxID=1576913 RepID=UPI0026386222|nr:polymer-forming cytoskeletal protein [uncultured Ferrovibrio sp.]